MRNFSSTTGSPLPNAARVILSLIPQIRPQLLDVFFTKNKTFDRKFTEFGGFRQGSEGDFQPTGETLAIHSGG